MLWCGLTEEVMTLASASMLFPSSKAERFTDSQELSSRVVGATNVGCEVVRPGREADKARVGSNVTARVSGAMQFLSVRAVKAGLKVAESPEIAE